MLIHYPPQLSQQQESLLKKLIDDWSMANGLCIRTEDRHAAVHAPVTMFPSPFTRNGFDKALKIQTAFNTLYANIALDTDWLVSVLEPSSHHDEFTARLLSIQKKVLESGRRRQTLEGGLFRSDYIVHKLRNAGESRQIKQVEFNTISVSFGGLATKASELHRFIFDSNRGGQLIHGEIPRSPALEQLSSGLAAMHLAYVHAERRAGRDVPSDADVLGKVAEPMSSSPREGDESRDMSASVEYQPKSPLGSEDVFSPPVVGNGSDASLPPTPMEERDPRLTTDCPAIAVLTIVQPGETNVIDQRLIEFDLFSKHHIMCYRLTLKDVQEKCSVSQDNKLIYLPTGYEISVVYYRAGYAPDDYSSECEWHAREMLENSHAIQCPSVSTQLAGTKTVQQLLTRPEVLAKHMGSLDKQTVEQLQSTFMKIWPMNDTPEGREGKRLAFENPEAYVLKPQREGGGNNIYREDIPPFLQSIDEASWDAYILMELIEPPRISNKIVRNGKTDSGRVVNELGVYGTVLWDTESRQILHNEQAGWLLRTKLQSSNEGGIHAGYGCLDSVLLNAR